MNEALHPLRLGEILDRTAQIFRSRFLVFMGIATIPAGTMFVFLAAIFGLVAWISPNASSDLFSAHLAVWALVILLSILILPASLGSTALGEAAMCDAAARVILGHPITIRGAYKAAWKFGWRYVGLLLLQGLAVMVGPGVVLVVASVVMVATRVSGYATNDSSPLFGGIIFLLIVVLGAFAVWMLLRVCLAFAASVVEGATAWNALKRSTRLSDGTRGRILVLYILGILLNQILTWVIAFPAIIVLALIPSLQGQAHAQLLGIMTLFVTYGAMFGVRALTKPVYGIALTLFYFDQRIRKEGFDIEWMMQQAGMVAVPMASSSPAATVIEPAISASSEAAVQAPAVEIPEPMTLQTAAVPDIPEDSKG
jgi:hypothetical protein